MPKFSDTEKKIIQEKLLTEGEKLFLSYGIKKVTVDDLVQAAGIAKGSFYAFYTNKEHLYMDIAERCQIQMWEELNGFLERKRQLGPKAKMKEVFLFLLEKTRQYPILLQSDSMVINYLHRKLPDEVIEAHTFEDSRALAALQEHGVNFTVDLLVAAKAFQALYVSIAYLQQEETNNDIVLNLMLDSLINQIVRDEND